MTALHPKLTGSSPVFALAAAFAWLGAGIQACPTPPEPPPPRPTAECARPSDCEGLPHVLCVGEWQCVQGKCAWDCSANNAPGDGGCSCTKEYNPVCDPATGITYDNPCLAGCANAGDVVAGECHKAECEPLACRMSCPNGLATDANGCSICECAPGTDTACEADWGCAPNQLCMDGQCLCRPVDCAEPCPNGQDFVRDENGCNTCECGAPGPEPAYCYSDADCPEAQHCSTSDGDCLSPCDPTTGALCPTVCAGKCVDNASTCICTREYKPVCGEDGVTYSNACTARCAGVQVVSEGECPADDDCARIRYTCEGQTPVCGEDGKTYACALAAKCEGHTGVAHEGKCECSIECLMDQPVCGTDGKTYGCGAAEAECNGVEVAYEGECKPEPKECCFDTMRRMCVDSCTTSDGGLLGNCFCSVDICQRCGGSTCACPDVWDPVCGADGRTYGNACEARCAGAVVRHEGECGKSCCPACTTILPQCGEGEWCAPLVRSNGTISGGEGECLPLGFCYTARDCALQGLATPACVGSWSCEEYKCAWNCTRG